MRDFLRLGESLFSNYFCEGVAGVFWGNLGFGISAC